MDCSLFHEGETVVVAVSGGADSVALLDLLARCRHPRLSLVVAHLNHCLRGEASDADQAFVAHLAKLLGLPFYAQRTDVARLAQKERLSLEDAGRSARYLFLTETASAIGASSIALAHHQDDQAETVLMRLLRGSGGSGLAAMRPVSQGLLKRPLLKISREELERYLKGRGLTWRTDESNADTSFLRNSIRHELIPQLKRYNPAVIKRLSATAEILAADEELLERLTEETFARHAVITAAKVALSCPGVRLEPKGLRMRVYRHAITRVQGDLARVGLAHLEGLDELIFSGNPSARLDLPGGVLALRTYDLLRICRDVSPFGELPAGGSAAGTRATPRGGARAHRPSETGPGADRAHDPWSVEVPGEGRHILPDGRMLSVEQVPHPQGLTPPSGTIAFLNPGTVPFPWLLRSHLPGDRLRPLGMLGEQKVKALFIDRKIPRGERHRVPLLYSADTLVWVCGVRLGECARIGEDTSTVLRVELLPSRS